MAEMMQFDLVSPERRLASFQASAVRIPAAEGEMTAMANHTPTITTLRPGLLSVEGEGGESRYIVTGGFAEIGAQGVSVLAEKAVPVEEMTREQLDAFISEARAELEKARQVAEGPDTIVDEAAKLLADMEALGDHMSL